MYIAVFEYEEVTDNYGNTSIFTAVKEFETRIDIDIYIDSHCGLRLIKLYKGESIDFKVKRIVEVDE